MKYQKNYSETHLQLVHEISEVHSFHHLGIQEFLAALRHPNAPEEAENYYYSDAIDCAFQSQKHHQKSSLLKITTWQFVVLCQRACVRQIWSIANTACDPVVRSKWDFLVTKHQLQYSEFLFTSAGAASVCTVALTMHLRQYKPQN